MSTKKLLLIFIKNPQKGKVKTRLAQTVGEQKALDVYHKLLSITKQVTLPLNCDRQVWYSDFIDEDDRWDSNEEYQKRLQIGDDLGERMKNAFAEAFSDGYKKVIIIGSDCAALTQEVIKKAFRALDDNNVVIGPSEDGGYYLLGMGSFYPDLFTGIEWSTPTVYRGTVEKVKQLDLSLNILPTLNDIDTEEDLIESALNPDRI